MFSKKHVLKDVVIEKATNETYRDSQWNDRSVEEASGNKSKILGEIIGNINFWAFMQNICFLLSQFTIITFAFFHADFERFDDSRNVK